MRNVINVCQTVDKLFSESKKRLRLSLREWRLWQRSLLREVENAKKQLEERQHNKDPLRLNLEPLRAEQGQKRLRGLSLHDLTCAGS